MDSDPSCCWKFFGSFGFGYTSGKLSDSGKPMELLPPANMGSDGAMVPTRL
jgi:hypothetical protein